MLQAIGVAEEGVAVNRVVEEEAKGRGGKEFHSLMDQLFGT